MDNCMIKNTFPEFPPTLISTRSHPVIQSVSVKRSIVIRLFFPVLICFSILSGIGSCKQKAEIPGRNEIADTLVARNKQFSAQCTILQDAVKSGGRSQEKLQELFLRTRMAYKSFEWAAEYFAPITSVFVNGPPVEDVEMPDMKVIQPAGLQVIEGILFPAYDTTRKKELIRQLDLLQSNIAQYESYFSKTSLYDWQIFEAARLEVFRIITLGITGFDNPLSLKSIPESRAALESMLTVFSAYNTRGEAVLVQRLIDSAISYCKRYPGFNDFNRMAFITGYCNPVTREIVELQNNLHIRSLHYNRLLNQDAKTLFDSNTFNVNAFAPDHSSFITNEKVLLGQKLFSDPVLSGTGKRSCQSCHQPARAFTDGLIKNTVLDKTDLLDRNTPTLINAALQPALFYDLRVTTLEDQSHSVVQSNNEMHGSMTMAVKKLWKNAKYRQMFLSAFPFEDKSRIDTFEIMNAIGSYIRSLVMLNSRFDEYMRGNTGAMDNPEIAGFNLFMGKAKCATCHYLPLFNGALPPRFTIMESEVIGVPKAQGSNEIDPDAGRYGIVKVKSMKYAFKIPTLRNAALTAPYMHNGAFSTLEQVLDFYNKGGGAGMGIGLENQTLPPDKLNLTDRETQDIIAFIHTLNSKLPSN